MTSDGMSSPIRVLCASGRHRRSDFGSYITTIALQVLVVLTLDGSAADVGFLNASRWLPYLLFGLVVGALVDRRRRQPILVASDVGRGTARGDSDVVARRVAHLADADGDGGLRVPVAAECAAAQSFLPRLVPQSSLLAANARLDQSSSVAQTFGP